MRSLDSRRVRCSPSSANSTPDAASPRDGASPSPSRSSTFASPGQAAAGVEFVLEGLHLTRRLAKELTDDGRTLYGS